MSDQAVHQCECSICQETADGPDKVIHHQINVLMSRLDEQQRRWYAAVEATRRGHGGIGTVSLITGLSEKTISRGIAEMEEDLRSRPVDRVRLPGGGRPPVQKNNQGSNRR
jgi:hypothetical protein